MSRRRTWARSSAVTAASPKRCGHCSRSSRRVRESRSRSRSSSHVTGQPPPETGEGRLVVGKVRGVHGLRGAVRVEVLTDNLARFDEGSTLFREASAEPLTVASSHRDGPGLLVRFAEVVDRQSADALRDAYLEAEIQPLEANEFYWHEI